MRGCVVIVVVGVLFAGAVTADEDRGLDTLDAFLSELRNGVGVSGVILHTRCRLVVDGERREKLSGSAYP